MDSPQVITCIEWCFGYGGNHIGLKRVLPGLRCIAACEIEGYALANMVSKIEGGGGWIHFLFGRMLKPSHVNSFEIWLTSSLRATLASLLVPPANEEEKTTHATSGHLCGGQLRLFDPDTSSLKTWRDMSRKDCGKFLPNWLCSDTEWKTAVASQRSEYSQRLKLAHRTSASASSSSPSVNWPTIDTAPFAPNSGSNRKHSPKNYQEALQWRTPGAMSENATRGLGVHPDKRKADGRQINLTDQMVQFGQWPTPNVPNGGRKLDPEIAASKGKKPDGGKAQVGLENAVQLYPSKHRMEKTGWATPCASKIDGTTRPDFAPSMTEQVLWKTPKADERGQYQRDRGTKGLERPNLTGQVKGLAMPTPRSSDSEKGGPNSMDGTGSLHLCSAVQKDWPTPRASESENRTTKNAPSHGVTHGKTLAGEAASARPTPTARDWKDGSAKSCQNVPMNGLLGRAVHGSGQDSSPDPQSGSTTGSRPESPKLSADWVEALMDVPPMWTDCGYSATESIPRSQPKHL